LDRVVAAEVFLDRGGEPVGGEVERDRSARQAVPQRAARERRNDEQRRGRDRNATHAAAAQERRQNEAPPANRLWRRFIEEKSVVVVLVSRRNVLHGRFRGRARRRAGRGPRSLRLAMRAQAFLQAAQRREPWTIAAVRHAGSASPA